MLIWVISNPLSHAPSPYSFALMSHLDPPLGVTSFVNALPLPDNYGVVIAEWRDSSENFPQTWINFVVDLEQDVVFTKRRTEILNIF